MDEGTVRQAAVMFSFVAEMNALMIGIESMKAENRMCEMRGESMGYGFQHFDDMRKSMEGIAFCLQTKI